MFKKNLALAICLGLSLTANTALAFNGEEEGEVASIGAQILDKAKSKFISAAGGQIASLFFDAIFGSSSGPSYVNLTEASLQAIQDRVHIEIVDSAEYQYIAAIESLELSIQYYSDTAQNGTPDVNVLGSLLINSNDLITHYSLNGQFNDEYYYLADSFSLVASLSMAIYVERNIQGFITNASVKAKAYQLANQLQTLLDAKKNADLPVDEECKMLTSPYDQYYEELCTLKDPYGNDLTWIVFDDSYYSPTSQDWDIEKDITEREYYADRFGKIEDVIYKLRNF
jgi:hypothetical protein